MELSQLKTLKDLQLTIPGIYGLELYPFQRLGVAAIQSTPRLILGDDVGLGKTVQTVAAIQLLHNTDELSRNDCLVITPKAVRPDWFKTFKTYTTLTPIIGDESDQKCKYLERKFNVLILGFPSIRVRIEQLKKMPWKMIVLDEGMFKTATSQTFAAVKQLTDKAQRVVILNATSLEIVLSEIYSHLAIIQPGLISLEDFKTRFCKVEKKYFKTVYKTLKCEEKIVGFKDLNAAQDLKQFMSKFYIKRAYEDVNVQLPEKIIKNIHVDLFPCQIKEYGAEVKKYQDKKLKGAQLLYNLLRICDGKMEDWAKTSKPEDVSAKGQALIDLVRSLDNEQIVVYSTYIDGLLACSKILKGMGKKLGFFSGMNEATRDQHLQEFKEGKRDVLMLTRAGQKGLNLENCRNLIMLNQLYNASARTQLEGRISRITSKHKNIFIYNLIASNSVEENVLELLDQRETISEYINTDGDNFKDLTEVQIKKLLKPRKSLIEEYKD
jgi:SNF2 family DNA or RNA helicase